MQQLPQLLLHDKKARLDLARLARLQYYYGVPPYMIAQLRRCIELEARIRLDAAGALSYNEDRVH